ncbi:MAG: carboxymuconolactone decarboxylase family protein [Pelagimonas sp.]|uniref:carboxymuconolactone decarboxylase family protein n=1 Tax=Pelagimonas sp. TaxID=2073170 RepID=UPI003D6B5D8D
MTRSPDPGATMSPAPELEAAGLEALEALGWGDNSDVRDIDEDLWHIVIRNNFGSIWARPGLSLRERELITIAVLVAIGAKGVSKHFKLAHAVGLTDVEVKEAVLQVLPYAGLPKVLEAMNAFKAIRGGAEPSL